METNAGDKIQSEPIKVALPDSHETAVEHGRNSDVTSPHSHGCGVQPQGGILRLARCHVILR